MVISNGIIIFGSILFHPQQKHIGDNIKDLCSYHRDGHARTNVLVVEVLGTAPKSLKVFYRYQQ